MATVALSTRAKADGRKRERTPALPAASVNAAFELHGLDIAYGHARVLCNVACNIPEGAVTAIMGPSGCGKSTLVKTLNRTLELIAGARVAAGTVSFRGQDLYAPSIDPRAVRKAVGIIHQRPVPFPMSILENVLFGASFLILVDLVARTAVAPAEIPIGVITAFLGAPFFVLALRKGGRRTT